MKTTISGGQWTKSIQTSFTVEELQSVEKIRGLCGLAEVLPQNCPLASSVVDGVMQLMKAFPDTDYNSEEGRWQLHTLVRWLLRPEDTAAQIKKFCELPIPDTQP